MFIELKKRRYVSNKRCLVEFNILQAKVSLLREMMVGLVNKAVFEPNRPVKTDNSIDEK